MTYFQVASGELIDASHMNAAINQGVIPFANAAARDAALLSPVIGQTCYLQDLKQGQTFDGSWWPSSGTMPYRRVRFSYGAGSPVPAQWTLVTGTPTLIESGGAVWTGTNGSTVVPVRGRWAVNVSCGWVGGQLGTIYHQIWYDGASTLDSGFNTEYVANAALNSVGTRYVTLDQGTVVQLAVYPSVVWNATHLEYTLQWMGCA